MLFRYQVRFVTAILAAVALAVLGLLPVEHLHLADTHGHKPVVHRHLTDNDGYSDHSYGAHSFRNHGDHSKARFFDANYDRVGKVGPLTPALIASIALPLPALSVFWVFREPDVRRSHGPPECTISSRAPPSACPVVL